MSTLRTIGLGLLFAVGVLTALVVSIYIFFRSLVRGARSFHPRGTVCLAEVTALDDVVGPRLAGPARVRFASSTAAENSPDPSIIGMGMKLGTEQDVVFATFESFSKAGEAAETTNVADYLANAVRLGRAVAGAWPRSDLVAHDPESRRERAEDGVAYRSSRRGYRRQPRDVVLEAREEPGPDGTVRTGSSRCG